MTAMTAPPLDPCRLDPAASLNRARLDGRDARGLLSGARAARAGRGGRAAAGRAAAVVPGPVPGRPGAGGGAGGRGVRHPARPAAGGAAGRRPVAQAGVGRELVGPVDRHDHGLARRRAVRRRVRRRRWPSGPRRWSAPAAGWSSRPTRPTCRWSAPPGSPPARTGPRWSWTSGTRWSSGRWPGTRAAGWRRCAGSGRRRPRRRTPRADRWPRRSPRTVAGAWSDAGRPPGPVVAAMAAYVKDGRPVRVPLGTYTRLADVPAGACRPAA